MPHGMERSSSLNPRVGGLQRLYTYAETARKAAVIGIWRTPHVRPGMQTGACCSAEEGCAGGSGMAAGWACRQVCQHVCPPACGCGRRVALPHPAPTCSSCGCSLKSSGGPSRSTRSCSSSASVKMYLQPTPVRCVCVRARVVVVVGRRPVHRPSSSISAADPNLAGWRRRCAYIGVCQRRPRRPSLRLQLTGALGAHACTAHEGVHGCRVGGGGGIVMGCGAADLPSLRQNAGTCKGIHLPTPCSDHAGIW